MQRNRCGIALNFLADAGYGANSDLRAGISGGLCWSSRQLGNVKQACKMLGYSRDSFHRFKELSTKTLPRKTSAKRPSGSKARPHKQAGKAANAASICESATLFYIQGSGNEVGKPFP
jgi:hypothetical protein